MAKEQQTQAEVFEELLAGMQAVIEDIEKRAHTRPTAAHAERFAIQAARLSLALALNPPPAPGTARKAARAQADHRRANVGPEGYED